MLKGLSKSPLGAELQQAHSFWVNRETRRRLLLGSFILDTQQAVLFEQQPVLFPKWPKEAFSAQASTLPCPCDNELWGCDSVGRWSELATTSNQFNLSTTADPTMYSNPGSLDPFRSSLILAYLATIWPADDEGDPDVKLTNFSEHLAQHELLGRYAHAEFDVHAHTAAKHTPIRSLLIVSGESWLFGKKLEIEYDFHAARSRLREWVGSDKAHAALWHATALLRMVFTVTGPGNSLAQSAGDAGSQEREMKMLHEQWSVYIAALICWACAFDETSSTESLASSSMASASTNSPLVSCTTSPSIATSTSNTAGYPPLMDAIEVETQMRRFLQTTDVRGVSELPAALAKVKGQTKGLLEAVRMRKISGAIGGLLNEGSGVLYRLVEGRSRISHF